MVGTRSGECCRQVEAEEVSNSRKKFTKPRTNHYFPLCIVEPISCSKLPPLRPRPVVGIDIVL